MRNCQGLTVKPTVDFDLIPFLYFVCYSLFFTNTTDKSIYNKEIHPSHCVLLDVRQLSTNGLATLAQTKIREEPNQTNPNGLSQMTAELYFHFWLASLMSLIWLLPLGLKARRITTRSSPLASLRPIHTEPKSENFL